MAKVADYLAGLERDDQGKLAAQIYRRFRAMVIAQVGVANGADGADDEARAAVLAMQSLATSTAAKAFKRAPGRPRLAVPHTTPAVRALLAAPAPAPARRQVSSNGRVWVDYDHLVDPDPFESYKHRRGGELPLCCSNDTANALGSHFLEHASCTVNGREGMCPEGARLYAAHLEAVRRLLVAG